MSSLYPVAHKPSFSGQAHTGQAKHITQPASPHFGAVSASDSTHFGASAHHMDEDTDTRSHAKSGARVWDRTKASLAGLTRGLLKDKWGRDIMVSLGIFLFTLPLAFIIPGSHFVLIPGYIALRRSLRGISGFTKGLISPDKILKPAK